MHPVNREVLKTMHQYGGSFAKALANAWMFADSGNSLKLYEAFTDLYLRYETMWQNRQNKD